MKKALTGNMFIRYCISYIIVLILPIVSTAAAFNASIVAKYRRSITDQIQLTAEKAMSDLERQMWQMVLISMQFSLDGEFDAQHLNSDSLIYRDIREALGQYKYISDYLYEITYVNCDSPNAYYTTQGTFNSQYFNHYIVNGSACTANEYLRTIAERMWVPLCDIYEPKQAFKQSLEYIAPVFNVNSGWLIFTIRYSQLHSMLDLSEAQLTTCAVLNADGNIIYADDTVDVNWKEAVEESSDIWHETEDTYILCTSSEALGLSCVYAISKSALLAGVDSMSRQFMCLLLIMLVLGCSLAALFSRILTRPLDAIIDTVRKVTCSNADKPSSISDVKQAIENVHIEHTQMQSKYIELERHNILMRLMSGQYVSHEEMEEDCSTVDLPTHAQAYAVVLIDELRMPTRETESEMQLLLGNNTRVFGFRFREQQCQVFLLAQSQVESDWRENAFALLKSRYPGVMMTLSSATDDLIQVRDSYQDAVFLRRIAQMKGSYEPVMSNGLQVCETQMVYPKQEIEALYNILKQKNIEKLSFIQDTLIFNLRTLSEHPVYQQALCYDIISTYNLALAKLEIGGRSDGQPFKQYDRSGLHIDELLDIIQSLYNEAINAFVAEAAPSDDSIVSEIIEYIDAQRENIPNACEIADHFGISPSNLSHQFKRITGETLSNYIADHKLKLARELLSSTDMDIAQISETLGYTHPSSFIRMFHRVEGITPAQYREQSTL